MSGALKDFDEKRRQVYKPVLDNPYVNANTWPEVSPQLAVDIVDLLSVVLAPLGKYHQLLKEKAKPDAPPLANKVTLGFNSTVKRLEAQAAPKRDRVLNRKPSEPVKPYLKYVFCAKADIKPALLIQSFPILAYTASRLLEDRVKLVPLGKGAMAKLLAAAGVQNTTIVGLEQDVSGAQPLYDLVDKIDDVDVPWLSGLFGEHSDVFFKPNLKVLKTSAPKVQKKQKQQRQKVEPGLRLELQKEQESEKQSKPAKAKRAGEKQDQTRKKHKLQ